MAYMAGIPQDIKHYSGGQGLNPAACVMHRTIGHWPGDYSVLSSQRVPSVHFLVGQDEGQWVQFWDTNWTTAHAAGANEYAVGIEFSGQNGEPLTDWQLRAGAAIVAWLKAVHGIPGVFLEDGAGRVSFFRGFLNHSNVATSPQYTHYDYITRGEFDRMNGGAPPEEEDMNAMQNEMLRQIYQNQKDRYDAFGGPVHEADIAASSLEAAQTSTTYGRLVYERLGEIIELLKQP